MIYIVEGETGEYSDRTNWLVKAFHDKNKAEQFLHLLEKTYKNVTKNYPDNGYWNIEIKQRINDEMAQLDDRFHLDYTGTRYYISMCELGD
jgi:hypothetical protein